MTQSRTASITFGIEVAKEFVSAYGPVSVSEIDRELKIQTGLNERNRQQVIEAGIATDWEQYEDFQDIYWDKAQENTVDVEFDFRNRQSLGLINDCLSLENWLTN